MFTNLFHPFISFNTQKSLPPGLSPPMRDVGPQRRSQDGLVGWEQVGNTRGDPWYGRPTRYVRRRAIIGSPPFSNFYSGYILTLKTCLDMRRPLTHPTHSHPRHHQPPPSHARASRRQTLSHFDAGCKLERRSGARKTQRTPVQPSQPRNTARRCHLTFAMLLRGFLVGLSVVP